MFSCNVIIIKLLHGNYARFYRFYLSLELHVYVLLNLRNLLLFRKQYLHPSKIYTDIVVFCTHNDNIIMKNIIRSELQSLIRATCTFILKIR